MEVNRYVRAQLIFTLFAQCLCLGLLLELLTFAIRSGARNLLSGKPKARSHTNTVSVL